MKLSKAIREGAKLRPQGINFMFNQGRSCALGAALEGIGLPYYEFKYSAKDAVDRFPVLAPFNSMPCPAVRCNETKPALYRIIAHLNDDHQWAREAIADWVESIESTGASQ